MSMSSKSWLICGAILVSSLVLLCLSALPVRAGLEFVTAVQLPNCWAGGIALNGNYLFTTGNEETKSLWVLDMTDPGRPKVASTWGPYYGFTADVAVQDGYAYVCDHGSLLVFDVTDPSKPTYITGISAVPSGWPAGRDAPRAHQVILRDSYAYLASGAAGVTVVDISDPTHPAIVGVADVDGVTWNLSVDGNYAYLAAGEGGLQIVSIADPAHPIRVGEYRPTLASYMHAGNGLHRVLSVWTSGGVAFVLSMHDWNENGRVVITSLDVINPAHPHVLSQKVLQGTFGAGYYGNRIAQIVDNFAFIIGRDTLTILDVSDPTAMKVADIFSLPKDPTVVYAEGVKGDLVPRTIQATAPWLGDFRYDKARGVGYLLDGYWGIWVLDMNTVQQPVLIGAMPTAGESRILRIWGNRAYLTDWNGGIFAFDITDPNQPRLLSQYYTGDDVHNFHGDGAGLLYVPRAGDNLRAGFWTRGTIDIMDYSNPARPVRAGRLELPDLPGVSMWSVGPNGTSVCWFENRLYVMFKGELFVYSAGRNPTLLSHLTVVPELQQQADERISSPFTVCRSGPKVLCYVGNDAHGLTIVDVTTAGQPSVVASLERPWRGTTMVEVQGDYAYVVHWADGGDEVTYNGIWVVNVANPTVPVYVSTFAGVGPNTERPYWIRVLGNRGWVADYSHGANEWDLSDPTYPVLVSANHYQATYNQFSLDVSGQYVYRADLGALEVYRILP